MHLPFHQLSITRYLSPRSWVYVVLIVPRNDPNPTLGLSSCLFQACLCVLHQTTLRGRTQQRPVTPPPCPSSDASPGCPGAKRNHPLKTFNGHRCYRLGPGTQSISRNPFRKAGTKRKLCFILGRGKKKCIKP